ncbi:hypothetical protein JCM8097_002553 [Rhodosporidiobolus ruineniae]
MLKAQEKQGLLPGPAQPVSRSSSTRLVLLFAVALLALLHLPRTFFLAPERPATLERTLCQQADSLAPGTNDRLDSHRALVFGDKYRNSSAAILGGLVRVKSESFDGEKDDDPRWDAFYDIANYLRRTFPLVYKHLTLEEVNTHGLLYTFAGSDTSLKPIILMAHTDTVLVNPDTLDQWSFEPWSGYFDGEYLWGRGATDCKNLVSGILEAVTLLLEGGFKPRRTVLISFGFDEESRGWGGAGELAKVIEQRYGKDGVAFLVDEGGMGVAESAYGFPIALPAMTEKGYLNANFTLHTAGGHSSVPPAHSGIGIISTLVSALEAHPFTPSLPLWSPTFSVLQCAATHGNLSSSLKRNVERGNADSRDGDRARQQLAEDYAKLGAFERFTVQTSQAVDIVHGGVKVNALPELVNLVVNYRVDISSSTEEVKEHIRQVVKPVAEQYGLEVNAFGETYSPSSGATSGGKLDVVATVEHPAAPLSPTVDNPVWDVFAGTIKHVFQSRFGDEKENPLVVSPSLMLGNTDVRWYTNVTQNRYRFSPVNRGKSFGQHTVDERLWFEDHLAAVWWYHELIRNADEAGFA